MVIRSLTRTAKNEFILRVPKFLLAGLKIKDGKVIMHAYRSYLIIESAGKRLREMAEGRRIHNKRLTVQAKAK